MDIKYYKNILENILYPLIGVSIGDIGPQNWYNFIYWYFGLYSKTEWVLGWLHLRIHSSGIRVRSFPGCLTWKSRNPNILHHFLAIMSGKWHKWRQIQNNTKNTEDKWIKVIHVKNVTSYYSYFCSCTYYLMKVYFLYCHAVCEICDSIVDINWRYSYDNIILLFVSQYWATDEE